MQKMSSFSIFWKWISPKRNVIFTWKISIIFIDHTENVKYQSRLLGNTPSIFGPKRKAIFSGKKSIFSYDTGNKIFKCDIFCFFKKKKKKKFQNLYGFWCRLSLVVRRSQFKSWHKCCIDFWDLYSCF